MRWFNLAHQDVSTLAPAALFRVRKCSPSCKPKCLDVVRTARCYDHCLQWRSRIFRACESRGWGVPGIVDLLKETRLYKGSPSSIQAERIFAECFCVPRGPAGCAASRKLPTSYESMYKRAMDLYRNFPEDHDLAAECRRRAAIEGCFRE